MQKENNPQNEEFLDHDIGGPHAYIVHDDQYDYTIIRELTGKINRLRKNRNLEYRHKVSKMEQELLKLCINYGEQIGIEDARILLLGCSNSKLIKSFDKHFLNDSLTKGYLEENEDETIQEARKIMPEIEKIFLNIEGAGDWESFKNGPREERKSIIDRNFDPGEYKEVRKQDLYDPEVTGDITFGKERERYRGKLLKVVLKRKGYNKINYQKLLKECKTNL